VTVRTTLTTLWAALLLVLILVGLLQLPWWLAIGIVAALLAAATGGMHYFIRTTPDDDYEIDIHARIAQHQSMLEEKLKQMVRHDRD
jgi:hypothetical protein